MAQIKLQRTVQVVANPNNWRYRVALVAREDALTLALEPSEAIAIGRDLIGVAAQFDHAGAVDALSDIAERIT